MPNPKREPTPGPWRAEVDSSPSFHRVPRRGKQDDGFGWCIRFGDMKFPGTICTGTFRYPDREKASADAHLIAASPDLLRAAEFTVEHFIKHGKIVGTLAIESLTAAIAKARGESDAS